MMTARAVLPTAAPVPEVRLTTDTTSAYNPSIAACDARVVRPRVHPRTGGPDPGPTFLTPKTAGDAWRWSVEGA